QHDTGAPPMVDPAGPATAVLSEIEERNSALQRVPGGAGAGMLDRLHADDAAAVRRRIHAARGRLLVGGAGNGDEGQAGEGSEQRNLVKKSSFIIPWPLNLSSR